MGEREGGRKKKEGTREDRVVKEGIHLLPGGRRPPHADP